MVDGKIFDTRTSVTKLTGKAVLVGSVVKFYAYSETESKCMGMLPAGRLG